MYKADPWWKSKRLIAAAVVIAVPVLQAAGIDIVEADLEAVLETVAGAVAAALLFWSKVSEVKRVE
jgi:imidazole glycerol phosphate synthase subunit HisF